MADDLNDLLGQFLNNPDMMEKLSGVLSSLGGQETASSSPATPSFDLSALESLISGGGGEKSSATSGPDLSALQKVLPLLQGKGDGNAADVALLKALRPYLHDGREKRIDEAIEMLRLAKLLPLLTKKS